MFVALIIGASLIPFLVGMVLPPFVRRHLPSHLGFFSVLSAPPLSLVACFLVIQKIDLAMGEGSGGPDYMGPLLLLVVGWPIFLPVALASMFLAAYRFAEA